MSEWRDVPGFEGFYRVSSEGEIKNTKTGKQLKPKKNNKGYYQVGLSKKGEQKWPLVHRLVALAFIPCDDESLTVDHDDNNKENNNVTNLRWVTWIENRRRATREGLILKGTQRKDAILTEELVVCIILMKQTGRFSNQCIADIFGVSQPVISQVINRKIWRHVIIPQVQWDYNFRSNNLNCGTS